MEVSAAVAARLLATVVPAVEAAVSGAPISRRAAASSIHPIGELANPRSIEVSSDQIIGATSFLTIVAIVAGAGTQRRGQATGVVATAAVATLTALVADDAVATGWAAVLALPVGCAAAEFTRLLVGLAVVA